MTKNEKTLKLPKNIKLDHAQQLTILHVMADATHGAIANSLQIHEITELAALKDEREVQRYLFILEGQKFVTPLPPGDFTSKTWQITTEGIRAIRNLQRTLAAA